MRLQAVMGHCEERVQDRQFATGAQSDILSARYDVSGLPLATTVLWLCQRKRNDSIQSVS